LRPECFDDLAGNARVASRVELAHGRLATERIGKDSKGTDIVWDFLPRVGAPVTQALADQVALTMTLEYPITVLLDGERETLLTFPRTAAQIGDNMREVMLSIANLPSDPRIPTSGALDHFRWFYELVDWGGGLPSELPAPRPKLAGELRYGGGQNGFCPSTTCP
jgi:hypothetical protein